MYDLSTDIWSAAEVCAGLAPWKVKGEYTPVIKAAADAEELICELEKQSPGQFLFSFPGKPDGRTKVYLNNEEMWLEGMTGESTYPHVGYITGKGRGDRLVRDTWTIHGEYVPGGSVVEGDASCLAKQIILNDWLRSNNRLEEYKADSYKLMSGFRSSYSSKVGYLSTQVYREHSRDALARALGIHEDSEDYTALFNKFVLAAAEWKEAVEPLVIAAINELNEEFVDLGRNGEFQEHKLDPQEALMSIYGTVVHEYLRRYT